MGLFVSLRHKKKKMMLNFFSMCLLVLYCLALLSPRENRGGSFFVPLYVCPHFMGSCFARLVLGARGVLFSLIVTPWRSFSVLSYTAYGTRKTGLSPPVFLF